MTDKANIREHSRSNASEAFELASNKNESALSYLYMIGNCSRVVDDLIDKDRPVSNEQVMDMCFSLLVEIPFNDFFNQFKQTLLPFHVAFIQAYRDANALETGTTMEKEFAKHLSDTINEIVHTVCWLTGGFGILKNSSLKIRKLLMNKEES
ncbi:MAG: hypothetical protein COA57_14740 [Flavobacteriales bacterium]|nr:MAG: hypothetical protein COA57_14740 [Flavobacteriales bacterium]